MAANQRKHGPLRKQRNVSGVELRVFLVCSDPIWLHISATDVMAIVDAPVAANTRQLCLINERGELVVDTLYVPSEPCDDIAPGRGQSVRQLKAGLKRSQADVTGVNNDDFYRSNS